LPIFLALICQKHLPIYQKYAVPKKIGFVGLRLLGDCGVGKVFVPRNFDVLESLFLRLRGQNRFCAYFTRLKIRVVLGFASYFLYP